jgi:RNA polymerase sigma factor (sigma-70 family)
MSTDLDLLAQYCLTRSREAFDAIVERHGPMVHRVGMRILRDRHDADDVVQLTFIQLSQKPETAYPQVAGWLHRVAQNTAKNLRRSQVSRARREEAKVRAMVATQIDDEGELREEIDAALDRLPPTLREAVILHYLEGRDYGETARISGCSEEAVRKRSQRGLRQLREVLAGRGVICGLAGLTAFFAAESAASAAVPAGVVGALGHAVATPSAPATAAKAAATGSAGAKLAAVAVAAALAGGALVHAVNPGDVRGWVGLGRAPAAAIPIPTSRPGFTALSLKEAATVSSTRPIFRSEAKGADVLELPFWGELTAMGIPFQVDDPRGGSARNVIVLHGPEGDLCRELPGRASVRCGLAARAIHLLSGVSGWGYPHNKDKTVSLVVRLRYEGGGVEDHPLLNGVHFADYSHKFTHHVPGSKQALWLKHGHQMRYLAITPGRGLTIEQIEFIKGDDRTAPVVMAVTVEAAV